MGSIPHTEGACQSSDVLDAETRVHVDGSSVLAEDVYAELVNGGAADGAGRRAELVEAGRDLLCGLVGEGEGNDAVRGYVVVLDDVANALDETEGLPSSWSGDDEKWPGVGPDGVSLGVGWLMSHCFRGQSVYRD